MLSSLFSFSKPSFSSASSISLISFSTMPSSVWSSYRMRASSKCTERFTFRDRRNVLSEGSNGGGLRYMCSIAGGTMNFGRCRNFCLNRNGGFFR
uniref:Putative secreted protein n=1 Tax=Anopheles darlingi TaxID=43151 RepID=A0A2M4DF60_ANODA